MAHNLYKNSMVYAGATPWHGLGVKLPSNATWERIAQLGSFYSVEKRDVQVVGGGVIPNRKALVRADTNVPLAVVTDSYCVVQFAEIAETLVEAAQGVDAIFHTAGLLGDNGSRGWLLAELPRVLRVKGDESEIRPYLLGTTSHDGHSPVILKNVATRVVCQNTLGSAMGEDSKFNVRIAHTSNASQRLESARKAFSKLVDGMNEFEAVANMLASTKFTDAQMSKSIDTLLPLKTDDAGKVIEAGKQLAEKRDTVLGLFQGQGIGISAGIQGTAWAAFQAWTEFADHHSKVRGDDNGGKRLESIWLGRAADLKTDALTSITSLIAA